MFPDKDARVLPYYKIAPLRNVFLFIRRFFTFFIFLALQGVALWFLFNYNRFHRAKFLGVANEVTGRINTQYNKVEDYFTLKEENKRLHRFNDSLLNIMPRNFRKTDTTTRMIQDSIPYDTLGHYRRYLIRDAAVLYNTVSLEKNYIQIDRGSNNGIRDNMAVINSDGGVVGVVVNTSPNFSQVMSLLHVQSRVNAALKKTGDFGGLIWDGKDPRFLTLTRIPKNVQVQKGDTVLTSSYSFNFPPGYMLGTIEEVNIDKGTNFYILKVRTAANFYNLQQVFVVENLQYDEQVKLNQESKKAVEEEKKTPK
jgi:rod shape-determining protein MreC